MSDYWTMLISYLPVCDQLSGAGKTRSKKGRWVYLDGWTVRQDVFHTITRFGSIDVRLSKSEAGYAVKHLDSSIYAII